MLIAVLSTAPCELISDEGLKPWISWIRFGSCCFCWVRPVSWPLPLPPVRYSPCIEPEPTDLQHEGDNLTLTNYGDAEMRALLFRTALAALIISTPFTAALAAPHGGGAGAFHVPHMGRSIGNSGQNSSRVGTTSRSYTSASRMDRHSVGQATATPGNTAIQVR